MIAGAGGCPKHLRATMLPTIREPLTKGTTMARAESVKRWAIRGGLASVAAGTLVVSAFVAIGPAHAAEVIALR